MIFFTHTRVCVKEGFYQSFKISVFEQFDSKSLES